MQATQTNGQDSIGGIRFVNETDTILSGSVGSGHDYVALTELKSETLKRTAADARLGEAGVDEESDSDSGNSYQQQQTPGQMKTGKKTKGRVKIKMEFIENKLRRYTTFSKRKTGIMKKAYELSTLTGTQVMLLVASETGHVYTFATRKLQPMITSEGGKTLIQTCLNSPDPSLPNQGQTHSDQRMNPTGFEETELSYPVPEDEMQKQQSEGVNTKSPIPNIYLTGSSSTTVVDSPTSPPVQVMTQPQAVAPPALSAAPAHPPLATMTAVPQTITNVQYVPQSVISPVVTTTTSVSSSSIAGAKTAATNISMHLPSGGITALLPASALTPGSPITLPPGTPMVATPPQAAQQTLYRIPTAQGGHQIISIPAQGAATAQSGAFMYQTPQGLVYATTPAGLPEGYIINLQQQQQQQQQQPQIVAVSAEQQQSGVGQQQYITIPVSMAAAGSFVQPFVTAAGSEHQKVSK